MGLVAYYHGVFLRFLLAGFLGLGMASFAAAASYGEVKAGVVFGFKPPMEKILAQYGKVSKVKVDAVYGTAGDLARQISLGAPYELFVCSDPQWEAFLRGKGLVKESYQLASNPVVLWTPAGKRKLELKDLWGVKVAIPDPKVAAYGVKAKEYLESAGLWEDMMSKGRIIPGGGPQRAALVAKTGMADGAIIGLSVAMDLKEGSYVEVPVKAPVMSLLVLKRSSREAKALADFMRGEDGLRIIQESGLKVLR